MKIYFKYIHSGAPKNLSKEDVCNEIRKACTEWERSTGNIVRFIKMWDESNSDCGLTFRWGDKIQFSGDDRSMIVIGESRVGVEEFSQSTIMLNGKCMFSNGRDTFWQKLMTKLSFYISLKHTLMHEIGHFLLRRPGWYSSDPASVMYRGFLRNKAAILTEEALLAMKTINSVKTNK